MPRRRLAPRALRADANCECPRGARGVDGRGVARDETGAGRGREMAAAARRRRSVSYY